MKNLSILVVGVCLCGLYGCSDDLKSKFVDQCIATGTGSGSDMTKAQAKDLCDCLGDGFFSSNEISDKVKNKLSRGEKGERTDKEQRELNIIFKGCTRKQ